MHHACHPHEFAPADTFLVMIKALAISFQH